MTIMLSEAARPCVGHETVPTATLSVKGRAMTRWGIGPKLALPPVAFGVLSAAASFRRPDLWTVRTIPYPALAIPGAILLLGGVWAYIRALRTLNRALATGALTTTGPYAVVRHPAYAAWILGILPGISLLCGSWPVLLTPLLAYASFRLSIAEEEEHLRRTYGEEYQRYAASVPRLIPRWPRPGKGADASRRGP